MTGGVARSGVDRADVLAKEADKDEPNGAYEKHADHQRGVPTWKLDQNRVVK
jgi:hypothetical protein